MRERERARARDERREREERAYFCDFTAEESFHRFSTVVEVARRVRPMGTVKEKTRSERTRARERERESVIRQRKNQRETDGLQWAYVLLEMRRACMLARRFERREHKILDSQGTVAEAEGRKQSRQSQSAD